MTKTAPEPKKTYLHQINRDWCKSCGICIHFCPRQVLAADETGQAQARHPENCIGCRMCEYRCPDLAINVMAQEEAS